MKDQPIHSKPDKAQNILTIFMVGLSIAPHFFHLGLWITGFSLCILLLSYTLASLQKQLPKLMLFILTLFGISSIVVSYITTNSHEAGVALLVIMLTLKLLELKKKRDTYIVIFICQFVLITLFLFDQSMAMMFYVIVTLFGLIVLQLGISRSTFKLSINRIGKLAGLLLLQAIPVALVLFIFFPRFIGPLWNLGIDQQSGITGLSDSITPGSISDLIQSNAVAFRVKFNDTIPQPNQRYWRGTVLWNTDGYQWTQGTKQLTNQTAESLSFFDQPVDYQVTLEPSRNSWLFALDLPAGAPAGSRLTFDHRVVNNSKNSKRIQYNMRSYLNYQTGQLSSTERQKALQLPDNITPRMHQLVKKWQASSTSSTEIVQNGLNHFRQDQFYYTLKPPRLGKNAVDQFLFDSKRGFCEHYATSFVTMMRLAGIPARVVTGYQGGELNPLGNYLIVRQSDAHAWSEVWLPDRGWIRTDPTAMVAPERIERHFDVETGALGSVGIPINFRIHENNFIKQFAKQLSLTYDMINTNWNSWVLGYTGNKQNQMMELLGLDFLKGARVGIGMVVSLILVLTVLTYWIWNSTKIRVDRVQHYYLKLCSKLAKTGLIKLSTEGPLAFAKRVATERPDLAYPIQRMANQYIQLRYREIVDEKLFRDFKNQVRTFRP